MTAFIGRAGPEVPVTRPLHPMLEPVAGKLVLVRVKDVEELETVGYRRLSVERRRGLAFVTLMRPGSNKTYSCTLTALDEYLNGGWLIVGEPGTEEAGQ